MSARHPTIAMVTIINIYEEVVIHVLQYNRFISATDEVRCPSNRVRVGATIVEHLYMYIYDSHRLSMCVVIVLRWDSTRCEVSAHSHAGKVTSPCQPGNTWRKNKPP